MKLANFGNPFGVRQLQKNIELGVVCPAAVELPVDGQKALCSDGWYLGISVLEVVVVVGEPSCQAARQRIAKCTKFFILHLTILMNLSLCYGPRRLPMHPTHSLTSTHAVCV
jgi:hypothetical protein